MVRIDVDYMPGDEPVQQHAERGQVLLDGRRRHLGLQFLTLSHSKVGGRESKRAETKRLARQGAPLGIALTVPQSFSGFFGNYENRCQNAMKEMKTSSPALSFMKFSTLVAILSATLTLSGCLDGSATLGEQMQISESIPMNEIIADQVVHQYIHDSFKDPYSVQDLTIGRPYLQKSYKGLVNGGGFNYVWNVPFSCNGKNSYGGYTGIKRSVALYNGSIISGYPLDEPL